MSDEIRINRPQVQPAVKPEAIVQPEVKEGSSKGPWIILGVIVIILVVGAVMFRGQLMGKKGASKDDGAAVSQGLPSGYQAIFLTNGQVYFGKLTNPNQDYLTLSDIYYLQVGPQQGSGAQASTAGSQNISLVKLGNELHGPVDEMHISRTQVLFYEDLKSDGQVVKAIVQDKASKATTPAK